MIYKPEFVFIPHSVNSFFGIIGMVYFFANQPLRCRLLRWTKAYPKPVFRIYLPVLAACFLSFIINQTADLHYVIYFISLILYFFIVYLGAVFFYKIYGELTPRILLKYFVAIAVIHVSVSLAMYANSSLNDLLLSLLKKTKGEESALASTYGSRLQGFGATFFTSGLINGFILIMISVGLYLEKYTLWTRVILYLSFALILVIGTMIARTIMIGGAIGILIMIAGLFRTGRQFVKNITAFSISVGLAILLGGYFIVKSDIDFEAISQFGFEIVVKLSEGDTSSHSTDSMVDMYKTMPDNLSTWMVGDARWKEGSYYYKRVDIGYLRNVFYFGIIGTLLLFLYNYATLRLVFVKRKLFANYSYLLLLTLFAYTLIINFKGTIDLLFYILPYYFCNVTRTGENKMNCINNT